MGTLFRPVDILNLRDFDLLFLLPQPLRNNLPDGFHDMSRINYNSAPTFFGTPTDWRTWLEKNHKSKTELWIGFYRADSNKPSITWSQAVEDALCFGWIDGARKSINRESYCAQFSPRKSKTPWSELTIRKIDTLIQQRRMNLAGLACFERRKETAKVRVQNSSKPQ